MLKICVFCGSSMGYGNEYRDAARKVGEFFAANNIELVYGGADVGLMKVMADTMLEKGSHVIGVMPGHLVDRGVVHHNLSQLITVETMAERKQKMVELSDGFIALPGGFGTLDELSEILTFNQLRISDKPLGILNIKHYFDHLLQFIDHAADVGFVRKEHRDNIIVSDDIAELITKMNDYNPLEIGKWIADIKVESNHK
ncbi:MAG: TIGR00730 family Rossman fold protein [Bacteroidetes bacterium]|nr:MAG: TIGR00730 family Rossman fold protein [Bacteroidota bacterium]